MVEVLKDNYPLFRMISIKLDRYQLFVALFVGLDPVRLYSLHEVLQIICFLSYRPLADLPNMDPHQFVANKCKYYPYKKLIKIYKLYKFI